MLGFPPMGQLDPLSRLRHMLAQVTLPSAIALLIAAVVLDVYAVLLLAGRVSLP